MSDPSKLFIDKRHASFCPYCGAPPRTTDHVPPKILLDDPLPDNLPVVRACEDCNNEHSADEAYLAGMVESILCGSADVNIITRPKVRRMFLQQPALRARIADARKVQDLAVYWQIEYERIHRVVLKLARGHATYELGETFNNAPSSLCFQPYPLLTPPDVEAFEYIPPETMCPEIGSRAFMRFYATAQRAPAESKWTTIQPGRYRYAVSHSHGVRVRMVLSEYLACEVCLSR
jgi:hypothetical protein